MFLLKKFVSYWAMPLPLALLLSFIALMMLIRGRRRKLALGMLGVVWLGLLTISTPWFADKVMEPLESQYPPYAGQEVRYVVVLGGYHESDPSLPITSYIEGDAIYRIIEGVRVALLNPEARLLVSGYARTDPLSNAEAYARLAESLGFPRERIDLQEDPRDTHEEALAAQARMGDQPFALVTSAYHMPRAMQLFEGVGLHPVPAPTGHTIKHHRELDWRRFRPALGGLAATQKAWHEYLGALWANLVASIS
ncbi:ElyC/SanA/YdcF family protein [Hahella aquimaris]|uniref:ElyC/SanA/YdcF family protein n=1 Tax=Hahella sp. HNIBRBA332 TaxID=3015983 RepID=UPI00273B1767|nr:ElyC/SanA/YdcF family protein [Hahella sp. HNIBRBA332]WLQ12561.1 ElyC/SanA/YdcF family protein [Hahella sp. HNIBRBA332]